MQPLIRIVLLFALAFCGETPYVLMISFDGFRYDYIDSVDTPNFDFATENGVKAESLIPVFPSLTFPNHYSIATGAYAGTHNITGNNFYDKKFKEKYSLYEREKVRDAKFYGSEPIWVTAERQGIKTASFFWVGSEAPVKGYSPSIFKYFDSSVPQKSRVDSVMSWFNLPVNRRPHLVMLYFGEPDRTGHNEGPNSPKIIESVQKMDKMLGYILNELNRLKTGIEVNLLLVSDHGMAEVSPKRLVLIEDYVSRLDDLYLNGRGALVQFDLKSHAADYYNKLWQELEKIPNCKAFKKSQIPERFHFNNRNTGDFLVLAHEGYFITSRESLDGEEFTLKGMHGYDPRLKSMHGIFYALGPVFRKNLLIPSFVNIHIYPLVCEIIGINPYHGQEDAPEGELKILQDILQDKK